LNKRLRIGFVGSGFASIFHAKGLVGVRDADVTGVFSRNEERAKKFAAFCKELGIGDPKPYVDLVEMARDSNIDALWIAVPNYARVPVVKIITEEIIQGSAELVGICCEKPLAMNVKDAEEIVRMVEKAGVLHGYLENKMFMPSVIRGKEIVWTRGASTSGRPYLARSMEEHGGPHEPWFWMGSKQGGGCLSDTACHCHEVARFLLTSPDERKESLKPRTVSAEIASLKWTTPKYSELLKDRTKGVVDYSKTPTEDYARSSVVYEAEGGQLCIGEVATSWCFVGPGVRLMHELIGPEYYLQINTLQPESYVFFSREVKGIPAEDIVEKQTAEQGLMPLLADEAVTYGYQEEDRHMVQSFLKGEMPEENWYDGLLITKIVMASYMAAEKGRKLKFPPPNLEDYVPQVQKETWNPKSILD